ncbi:MAG: hypothetical protein R2788_00275 [Saprospiraceae bacterium]
MTNDADAAGISEMQYGVGKEVKVRFRPITIGTGLGVLSAVLDGKLVEKYRIPEHCLKETLLKIRFQVCHEGQQPVGSIWKTAQ